MSLAARHLSLTLASALVAFAANSLLCRQALLHTETSAFVFTLVRLVSGAVVLLLFVYRPGRDQRTAKVAGPSFVRRVLDAAWLVLYALPFSLAYRELDAGTGALILFGAVQLTMMLSAILKGERPSGREWFGLVVAFLGLVYLVSPGVHAPDPVGALLMTSAGVGWGLYTLAGRRALGSPIERNARSFAIGALSLLPFLFVPGVSLVFDSTGLLLAAISGATASALGYVLWYSVLPQLSTTRAALAQLLVPIIAAFGGVFLLGEVLRLRLVVASVVVLGALAYARSKR